MQMKLNLALVAGLVAAGAGMAVVPAFAACAALPAGAPVVNPGDLLSRFPGGGGGMVSEVRNMVATNPSSLDGIPAILAAATSAQKEAIGAGLGQAAGLCTRQEPTSARRIQEAVLGMNNSEVSQAFQTVTGDRQTAATGGGAGGGGGGGGGTGVSSSSTAGGSSSYFPGGNSSSANSTPTFSSGSGGFAGLATTRSLSGTGTTTNTTSPLSTATSPISVVSSPSSAASLNQP